MAELIDGAQIVAVMQRVAGALIELQDYFCRLDAAMGDGDMGITAAKGASGMCDYITANPPGDDLGKFLMGAGTAFNKAAPSTLGALTMTALMRAAKEAKGQVTLDAATLVRMLHAADAGIQERGKSKPGDKTVVDALHPAAVAFGQAIAQGQTLNEAGATLLRAAREGRDAAIPWRSKIGRAGWVGERTENQPDPGTVLFVRIVEIALGFEPTDAGSTLGRPS